jgi:ribonuclease HI
VTIHGDSNLVINQLNGKWRVRKGLYLSIATESKELLAHLRGLGWQINFPTRERKTARVRGRRRVACGD